MNAYLTYGIIFVILLALELCYFKVADHFNMIDKPNERSSHSTIVLRGGGYNLFDWRMDLERLLRISISLVSTRPDTCSKH